jgi:hypothetical protein
MDSKLVTKCLNGSENQHTNFASSPKGLNTNKAVGPPKFYNPERVEYEWG